MTLYDRILVPTDGSSEGRRAVVHALDLASVHGASVHALYVVNTASYAGMPMETAWEGIGELLRSDAETAVAAVEELAFDHDVDVSTSVVEGSPSREIIRHAEDERCDLIVMGTHGRGGLDRLLLGSVTEKVVRGSSIPVLTVRVADGDGVDPQASSGDVEATTDESGATNATEPTGPPHGDGADGSIADSEPG